MTSIADYMKSPSSRPYYVLIGSLSIAIYMIITGLAADSKIFNSYASSTDKGMGGLQIVALSLLAVALAFTAAAVCCPKLRKTFHVVVFSTLAAAFVFVFVACVVLHVHPGFPIPVMPTPFSAILAALVATIISIFILIIPCLSV